MIIFILTALGGVVAGLATGGRTGDAERFMQAVAISNLLLGTVGFTIAGCLAPPGRWRHLSVVAVGAWLTGLINVAFFGVGFFQWLGGVIIIALMMAGGGALSFVFRKR